jgi:phenol/toluene 2-monooxygenase (NADH) P1/A1
MQIDLRTVAIEPQRQTFANVAARLGDKPASRYLESMLDVQPDVNFHYRPTWDPEHKIFDPARTAIRMKDWYIFRDPRQFYYGTYTFARSRMQETGEADLNFVEERGLGVTYPAASRDLALRILLPLRHVAWGSNLNNAAICAYGYGTAITQPALFYSMDQLGIAQYLTRLGLVLGSTEALAQAKRDWLEAPLWQPLRRYVEDSFVVKDWFELFVAQNLVLDGLLYPLVYDEIEGALAEQAGPMISMLTRFPTAWFAETSKWVDSVVKPAAAESPENRAQLAAWVAHWSARAAGALAPIAQEGLGARAAASQSALAQRLRARCEKSGLGA